jgi:Tol biopolymer transport system component
MPPLTRVALLLAACGAFAACGSNEPGPDPGPGRLIFTRSGNQLRDIYAIDASGRNLLQLTTSFALDDWAAWSPDTFKILFQSDRIPDTSFAAHFQIYVMNSDGSSVNALTSEDSADSYHPAWAPDGSKIVFGSNRDGNPEIYVMDSLGNNEVNLTNNLSIDRDPAWQPAPFDIHGD